MQKCQQSNSMTKISMVYFVLLWLVFIYVSMLCLTSQKFCCDEMTQGLLWNQWFLRRVVFDKLHSLSHPEVKPTLDLLLCCFVCPGIKKNVKFFVFLAKKCERTFLPKRQNYVFCIILHHCNHIVYLKVDFVILTTMLLGLCPNLMAIVICWLLLIVIPDMLRLCLYWVCSICVFTWIYISLFLGLWLPI